MTMNPMRVGVVGAGIISEIYLTNMIHRFDSLEVAAICSQRMDSARRRAAQFGIEARTFEAILSDPSIEMIVNLTPTPAHEDIIRRALRNQRELLAKMIRGILYENRDADASGDDSGVGSEPQSDDIFASSLAYFRRRRTPRSGEPAVLAQYYVALDCGTDFSPERIRAAAQPAFDEYIRRNPPREEKKNGGQTLPECL